MIYYQFPEAIIHCSRNNSSGFMHLISIAPKKWDEFSWASVTFGIESSTELWVTVTGAGQWFNDSWSWARYRSYCTWSRTSVRTIIYILIKYKWDRAPEKQSTAMHMKNRQRQVEIMFLILRPKQFSAVWIHNTGNCGHFHLKWAYDLPLLS